MDLHELCKLVQFPIHCLSVYHHQECQEPHGHHQLLFQELCHIPSDTSSSPPEVQKHYLEIREARQKFDFTYCKAHLQIFGNHKVAVVPVVSQVFNCEVDLSTVLTRMLIMFHFFCYPRPTKVGSRKHSIFIAKGK